MRFKFLLVTIAFIISGLTIAHASETRVKSLGGTGFFINDETNIFYFPATIIRYSNLIISELRIEGQSNSYSFGIHLPLQNCTFGLYLNLPTNINPPVLSYFNDVQVSKKMMLFFGTKLSSFDIGFNLSYLSDKYNDDNNGNENSLYLALGLGISNKQFDAGLRLEYPHKGWKKDRKNLTWNGFGIGVYGRYFQDINNKLQFIPVIHLLLEPTSIKDQSNNSMDMNVFKFGLGLGTKYQISENNFLIIGTEMLGYDRLSLSYEKYDSTTSSMVLPGIYAGIESTVKKWLKLRFGAVQVFKKNTTSMEYLSSSFEHSTYNSGFTMTFGLGILLGNFRLDADLNENLLFEGPNILSGSKIPLADKISLSYLF